MSDGNRLWYLDLVLVVLATACAGGAIYAGVGGALRIALGLPLIVFLPGYSLVALLFPTRSDEADADPFDDGKTGLRNPLSKRHGIDRFERLGLSVALSVAIVPAVAFVANFTAWGITPTPILVGVCAVTVALALLAFAVRSRAPADRRVGLPRRYLSPLSAGSTQSPLGRNGGRGSGVVLALTVLLFLGSVGFALAYPPQSPGYTEFYVETENVTGDTRTLYPASFGANEARPLTVGLENREHEAARYTVVAELQRVSGNGSNATVRAQEELARTEVRLEDGETRLENLTIRPTMTGERLRLRVLLYEGRAPANADAEGAYRVLTLWVDVGRGAGR